MNNGLSSSIVSLTIRACLTYVRVSRSTRITLVSKAAKPRLCVAYSVIGHAHLLNA